MITKLEAINIMLSCVNHAPLNTLIGTVDSFTLSAIKILEDEVKNFQAEGWNFNSENNYTFYPDSSNTITIADDIYSVKFHSPFYNEYVIKKGKIYNRIKHTFTITKPIKGKVVFIYPFEDLPPAAQLYVQTAAAYKFTKRTLGAQTNCIYTQEDLIKARTIFLQQELETGQYNFNSYKATGRVRRVL